MVPISRIFVPRMVFFNSWPQGTLCLASGNSAGISGISGDSGDSGDSGEMGEAGAPRTLPSTRAWGQDDGSSHKLPQIIALAYRE